MKSLPLLAAAAIVLGAIWWGGATTQAAQAAVLGALGALFVLAPPQHRAPRGFIWLALAWLALASAAFLPAAWFPTPEWRTRLSEAGVMLPTTLTPQPALTLEALAWLIAGLAWAGWLAPDADTRRRIMRVLACGIALIAAAALIAWNKHWHIPGWLSERGFGPFPNRNHTGHVLALGGILALGCAADAARHRLWRALPWLAATAVIGAALIANYSRGGILLFLGAAGLWAAIAAWQRRSWKVATLAAAALLAGAACTLLASHTLSARFTGGGDSQIAFRTLIWRDTLHMIGSATWCGDGLGNFRGLFPFFREASVIQQAVWHPESDWLWLAAENSWLGVVLALALFVVLARDAFPLARGTQRRLRTAALAGAIGAAFHALIDVPAHRPGSALLALFALALARQPEAIAPSAAARWAWRGLGVALLYVAFQFTGVHDELPRAQALAAAGRLADADAAAQRAIERAPLAWQGYYTRAALAAHQGRVLAALEDFRRARLLEPHHVIVPLDEGRLWARLVPALALPAWQDALRRVGPPQDVEIFRAMLQAAPDDPNFRAQLRELVINRPELRQQWNASVPPAEREASQ